jgi:hypothetical protein
VSANLLYCFLCFMALQIGAWFSTNLQLTGYPENKALTIAMLLAVPTTLLAYYGTKFGYAAFDSAWSVRFFVFAVSYLIFPMLTWWFLGETMFTIKTMSCIALSIIIILVQVYL